MSDNKKTIGRIDTNDTNYILITSSEFNGKTYYDVRKWFVNNEGKDIVTKKGMSLDSEQWQEVIGYLQNAFEGNMPVSEPKEDVSSTEPNLEALNYDPFPDVFEADEDFNPFD